MDEPLEACDQALFDRIYCEYPWVVKDFLRLHIVCSRFADVTLSEDDRYSAVVQEMDSNGILDVEDPSYARDQTISKIRISNDEARRTTIPAAKKQSSSEPIKRVDVNFDKNNYYRTPRAINARIALLMDTSKYAYVLGLLLEADLPRVDPLFLNMLARRWEWMSKKQLRDAIREMKETENYVVKPVNSFEADQWSSIGERMYTNFMRADLVNWYNRGLVLRWNDTSRIMSHLYEFYSWTQLHREFLMIESAHIEKVLKENNYHYYPSYRKLHFQCLQDRPWELPGFLRSTLRDVNDFPNPSQPHKKFYMEYVFLRRRESFLNWFGYLHGGLSVKCESCHECITLMNFKFERCLAFQNSHVYCHFCLRKRVRRLRVKFQLRPKAINCWSSDCTSYIRYDDSYGMAQATFRENVFDILEDFPAEYGIEPGPATRDVNRGISDLVMEANKDRVSCFEGTKVEENGEQVNLVGTLLTKVGTIVDDEVEKLHCADGIVEIEKEKTEKIRTQSGTTNGQIPPKPLTADNRNYFSFQQKGRFEQGLIGGEIAAISSATPFPSSEENLCTPLNKRNERKASILGGGEKMLPSSRNKLTKKEVSSSSSSTSSTTDEPPSSSHSSRESEELTSTTYATLSSTDEPPTSGQSSGEFEEVTSTASSIDGTSSSPASPVSIPTARVDIDSTFRAVVVEQMQRVSVNGSDWERPEVRWNEIVPPVKRRRSGITSQTSTATSGSRWSDDEGWTSTSSVDSQENYEVTSPLKRKRSY